MAKRDNRLSITARPLSYEGIRSQEAIYIFSADRAPNSNDNAYSIGTEWIDVLTDDLYQLVDLSNGSATWTITASPGAEPIEFDCNTGSAIASLGVLEMVGDSSIITTGSGSTVTVDMAQGFDGQVLIATGGGSMAYDYLTAGTGITITTGPNSISIEDSGGAGVINLAGDAGTANPVGSNIQIAGGTNMNTVGNAHDVTINLDTNVTIPGTFTITSFGVGVLQTDVSGHVFSDSDFNGTVIIGDSAGSPAWGEITSPTGSLTITYPSANTIDIVNAGVTGITQFVSDSGNANQAAGNINVYGGTNLHTTASGDHVNVLLDTNVTLSGTLTLPWTNGTLWTTAAGVVASSNGSDGEVLIGGDTAPVWDTIQSSTLTITNGPNSIEIADANDGSINSFANVSINRNFLYWEGPNLRYGGTELFLDGQGVWNKFGPSGVDATDPLIIYWHLESNYDVITNNGTPPVWTYNTNTVNTGYFTAPATGKYFFQINVDIATQFTSSYSLTGTILALCGVNFITTGGEFLIWDKYQSAYAGYYYYDQENISYNVICHMDAGDSAEIEAYADFSGSTKSPMTVRYPATYGSYYSNIKIARYPYSWISGYLIT